MELCVSEPQPDQRDFRCAYTIRWPTREQSGRAFGVDSLQALFLALQSAHIALLTSPEGQAGELRWLGMADLGLPLPLGLSADEVRASASSEESHVGDEGETSTHP